MKTNYGTESFKNWKGQEAHPIDSYCNFQTGDTDREHMIALFDAFANGDKDTAKRLSQLLNMVGIERAREEEYNSACYR